MAGKSLSPKNKKNLKERPSSTWHPEDTSTLQFLQLVHFLDGVAPSTTDLDFPDRILMFLN